MDGVRPEQSEISKEVNPKITVLTRKAEMTFHGWLKERSHQSPQLHLPADALHYFISPRAFELASDPEKVRLRILDQSPTQVEFLVVEKKSENLTSPEVLDANVDELRKSMQTDTHPQIDTEHWEFIENIQNGTLRLSDFIITGFGLRKINEDVLQVESYSDRDSLRKKGLATAQYMRLREAAAQLGFRIITGSNNEGNIGFFIDKLGRVSLDQIDPGHYGDIIGNLDALEDVDPQLVTVDFLNPEDRDRYVINHS